MSKPTYNFEEACKIAEEESIEHCCVQHVNKRLNVDNAYYVSEWYDCDSTVQSYENGEPL